MTDLEWNQLQYYRRWRKRLQEHPYKALFGASEDMLRGKGLTNWDWVYKTFPKWMLQEMDANEQPGQSNNTDKDNYCRFPTTIYLFEADNVQHRDMEIER
jgi:hypothetical protein